MFLSYAWKYRLIILVGKLMNSARGLRASVLYLGLVCLSLAFKQVLGVHLWFKFTLDGICFI